MKLFIIKSNQIKRNCLKWIEEHVAPYGDDLLEIVIQVHKNKASLQQRRYLFSYVYVEILNWWKDTGIAGDAWDELTKSEAVELVHEWCKEQFINPLDIEIMDKPLKLRTTTKMSTEEFSAYWGEIQRYFAPHGLVIHDPNPYYRK